MIKNKNVDPSAAIDGTKLKDASITAAKLTAAAGIGLAQITANSLDGTVVKNCAAVDVIGGIPVVHHFSVATTGATTTDTDITLTHKTKFLYAIIVKTSTASANNGANTVQLLSTTSAITDAKSVRNIADETIVQFTTWADANSTIAAGGKLRLERVLASASDDNACEVYVFGVRSA